MPACGGSTVYIRNQATASLYNYTPYQPNNAAKAAGYGLGDGCSSYGNRNFFLYYSDWFGIPRGYVDTVKLTANGAVHIAGWTFDPLDSSASIDAHVYITNIDKQKTSLIGLKANHSRNDVNSAYSISGLHGFDGDVSLTSGGGHYQICVYGVTGSRHIDLGCTVVDATAASPRGVLDSATATADGQQGGITVRGWAYDPGTPETSIPVHVYVTDPNGTNHHHRHHRRSGPHRRQRVLLHQRQPRIPNDHPRHHARQVHRMHLRNRHRLAQQEQQPTTRLHRRGCDCGLATGSP
jgi:hypothetical protein